MTIHKHELLDLFYECKSYYLMNSGNESVEIEELIELLKNRMND